MKRREREIRRPSNGSLIDAIRKKESEFEEKRGMEDRTGKGRSEERNGEIKERGMGVGIRVKRRL